MISRYWWIRRAARVISTLYVAAERAVNELQRRMWWKMVTHTISVTDLRSGNTLRYR